MSNRIGWWLLVLLLPLVNLVQTFGTEKLYNLSQRLEMGPADIYVMIHQGLGWGISMLLMLLLSGYFWPKRGKWQPLDMLVFLLAYLGWYIFGFCLNPKP